jgi:hypothetical protein
MLLLLFITANCAIGFIPALLAAQGQRETKTHQIGVLTDNAPRSLFAEGFRGSLRDLGYVEGRNLAIDWRSTEGRPARRRFRAPRVSLCCGIPVIPGIRLR